MLSLSDHGVPRPPRRQTTIMERCDGRDRMATRFTVGLPDWEYSLTIQVWR